MTLWADVELAEISDVRARLVTPEFSLQLDPEADDIDEQIQSCLDAAKDDLRKHLSIWARDNYPSTVKDWMNLRLYEVTKYRERMDLDKLPPYSGRDDSFFWEGSLHSATEYSELINPDTYATNDTPVSGVQGTWAGTAENESRLVDYKHNKLYINRGTKDSPTWERSDFRDALNYIDNPEELVESHLLLTIQRMFERGLFRARVDATSVSEKSFFMDSEAFWQRRFLDELYGCSDNGRPVSPGVLKLLSIDFSGNGDLSDFELNAAGQNHFGFA